MMINIQKHKGYSLMEVMLVVAIIGILAAAAVPIFSYFTKRAKVENLHATMLSVAAAQESHFAANGAYTAITQMLKKYNYPEIEDNQRIATGVIVTNGIGTSYWVAGVVKLEPDCSEFECYMYLSSLVGTSNPGEFTKMKEGDACIYDKASSPFKCECY